jgi:hypothetical protein
MMKKGKKKSIIKGVNTSMHDDDDEVMRTEIRNGNGFNNFNGKERASRTQKATC